MDPHLRGPYSSVLVLSSSVKLDFLRGQGCLVGPLWNYKDRRTMAGIALLSASFFVEK